MDPYVGVYRERKHKPVDSGSRTLISFHQTMETDVNKVVRKLTLYKFGSIQHLTTINIELEKA